MPMVAKELSAVECPSSEYSGERRGFSLTEVLVHLGFHFRRPLFGVASGVSGLSVS